MKKIFIVFLVLMLLLFAAVFSSCTGNKSCTHEWGEWEVVTAATCGMAGSQKHTCTCGASETVAIPATGAHTYNEWQIVIPATCGMAGSQKHTCTCGATETVEIPATGAHSWSTWMLATKPTCIVEGEYISNCACGLVERRSVAIDPDAHSAWSVWEETQAPTVTAKGEQMRTCVCGEIECTDIPMLIPTEGVEYTLINGGTAYAVSGIGTATATDIVIAAIYNNKPVVAIENHAFFYCTSLASIEIPDSVTTIGDEAFTACTSLASIEIPDSVTTIGVGAFTACTSLASIEIPDSVTTIGVGAFFYCSGLESITVAQGNTVYHSSGNCLIETANKTLILGSNNSVIPTDGSVMIIGEGAFTACTSLASIEIPDGVTTIGSSAFNSCISLTSIMIPASVTTIGSSAFAGCTSLASIEIPDSVTTIGDRAFAGCTKLTSITIPMGVTEFGVGIFGGCSSNMLVKGPWVIITALEGWYGYLMLDYIFDGSTTPPDLSFLSIYTDFSGFYIDATRITPFDFEAWLTQTHEIGDTVTLYARMIKPKILFPMMIEKMAFEEKLLAPMQAAVDAGEMTMRDFMHFRAHFALIEQDSPGVAEGYPITAKKGIDIYVYNDSNHSPALLRTLESLVLEYTSYTFADLAADYAFVEYEG